MEGFPKVFVIVVNWNNWRDTLECLESVLRLAYPNYKVVVCDNNSTDDSVEKIIEWAEGKLLAPCSSAHLQHLTSPPVLKPVTYRKITQQNSNVTFFRGEDGEQITIIQNKENMGYAGGNNVGLRYAIGHKDFAYAWLLNNDTVVCPDSLTHLVKEMEIERTAGLCGSTLLYYQEPNVVQALGGATYNKWLGLTRHRGEGKLISQLIPLNMRAERMDYIVGASMLVSREFINKIGLLCEDYFLYYEELDWALRAKGKYRIVHAIDSIVYHKEGGSTGSGKYKKEGTLQADLYSIRNRIAITKKYFPLCLPTIYCGLLMLILNRMLRGQWDRIPPILKVSFKNKDSKGMIKTR